MSPETLGCPGFAGVVLLDSHAMVARASNSTGVSIPRLL
jgi:hypothetical protein